MLAGEKPDGYRRAPTHETLMVESGARVVEWQTRMFEGHVAQAVQVQVLSRAPFFYSSAGAVGFRGRNFNATELMQ